MKTILFVFLAMALVPDSRAAESSAPAQVAVLQREVCLPETDNQELPRLSAGQDLMAIRVRDDGYVVVCRDEKGQTLPAFLPFRDEWGHVTANAWTRDLALSNHVVRVTVPVSLRPVHLRLGRGGKYPVAGSGAGFHTILFPSDGCLIPLSIPAGAVVLEDLPAPPPLGPVDARKRQLEDTLAQRLDDGAKLQERNRQAADDNARMLALLKQLSDAEMTCGLLKAQIARNEDIRQQLLRYTPETARIQDQQRQQLAKIAQQQAAPAVRLTTAEMETSALEGARKELLRSDADLEGMKAKAAKARAELDALVNHLGDPAMVAEKEKLRGALQAEAKTDAQVAGAVVKTGNERDVQKAFLAQIEAVRQEIKVLQASLDAIVKEMEALKPTPPPPPAATPPADGEPDRAAL